MSFIVFVLLVLDDFLVNLLSVGFIFHVLLVFCNFLWNLLSVNFKVCVLFIFSDCLWNLFSVGFFLFVFLVLSDGRRNLLGIGFLNSDRLLFLLDILLVINEWHFLDYGDWDLNLLGTIAMFFSRLIPS